MSVTLSDMEYWTTCLMAKEGITNFKIDRVEGTNKGDNYLGVVNFVKVTAKPEDDIDKIYDLVVKSVQKSNEIITSSSILNEIFKREIFMYSKVFPSFHDFHIENEIENVFNKFPKCYSICGDKGRKAIILKNMKSLGFEVHDRRVPQNLNHVQLIFQNYGKFHAISFALRKKNPALFDYLTQNMTDLMGKLLYQANHSSDFAAEFATGVDALRNSGMEDLANRYDGFQDHIEEYVTNFADPNSPQSVILHGDCWNNNMMFRYEKDQKMQPTDMCFLDFQYSRVASPVFDLSYYLYTCADKAVLDRFDFLLQEYYLSLSHYLKKFDCDVKEVLTMEELKDHWKKYGNFGLSRAPIIIKVELGLVGNSGEAEDLEHWQKLYKQRLVDVLSHFAEKFL